MKVKGKSVKSLVKLISYIGKVDSIRLARDVTNAKSDVWMSLGFDPTLEVGQSLIPTCIGKVTAFNASGQENIRKDLPMKPQPRSFYTTWQDWHHKEHSGIQTRYIDMYQREYVPAPSECLHVVEMNAAVKSSQAPDHLALILSHLAPKYVADKMNTQHVLTNYLSENGHLIFASDISAPNDLTVVRSLSIKFHNLSSLEKNKALLDFAHKECLYEINPENIGFLLASYPNGNSFTHLDHTTANYSAICSFGSEELKRYIDDNLMQYIETVFLTLPNNVKESPESVRELVNAGTIDNEQKQQIISKQEMVFEKFEGIPTDLWGYVLSNEKINISWQNISTYLKQEECENEVVTEILNQPHIVGHLSLQNIKISEFGEIDSKSLSSFILENEVIKDTGYCKLIKCLPYFYLDFPNGISPVKIHCLAKTGTIRLTEKSFNSVKSDELLLSLLIGSNVKEYLTNKEKYPITDTVRENLLSFDMSNEQKIPICIDVTPSGVKTNKKLSRYVADVIKLPEVDCSLFANEVIISAIVQAQNIDDSIQILIKCIPTWDGKMTMDVLGQLPTPFSEITEYGKSPKLPKTLINYKFAKLLETNGIISSATEKENHVKINTFKSSD